MVNTKKMLEERASVRFTFSSCLSHVNILIVQAAEDRYQRELVAHAEAVKTVDILKQQLAQLQVQVREKQTAADSAQSMLTTAESSWKSQKAAMDKEITDLNTR